MTVEKLSSVLLLLLLSSLCPIAKTDQSAVVSNSFVNDTCNKFEEKFIQVCIALIESDPHQDLKLNYSGLLNLFINHALANATDSLSYLVEQLKRSDLDNNTRFVFGSCVQEYERGIASLKSSLEAVLKQRDKRLGLSMSYAYETVEDCEFEFELDYVAEPPSWLSRYLSLRNLMELSTGIANLLQCKRVAACDRPYYSKAGSQGLA